VLIPLVGYAFRAVRTSEFDLFELSISVCAVNGFVILVSLNFLLTMDRKCIF
jgi:hypothetical protein